MTTNRSRCILFSYAHPDDESFLAAGTICRYRDEGVNIVLFTATRGEAGKAGDPPVCSARELPQVRERELRAAAGILGIQELYLSHFPDRELSGAPIDQVREVLVGILRRHRPQVVVTFDPHGANRHPDHAAISRFTSDAIAAAADPRWFPHLGPGHRPDRLAWNSLPRPWEAARHPGLSDHPGVDFIIDTRRWWQQKAQALRAHRSQHLGTEKYFLKPDDQELLMGVEVYRQGWGPPLAKCPEEDLFAGV